jgi:hypothetical protein
VWVDQLRIRNKDETMRSGIRGLNGVISYDSYRSLSPFDVPKFPNSAIDKHRNDV